MTGMKVKIKSNSNKKNTNNKIYKIILNKNISDDQPSNDKFDINIGDKIKHKVDLLIGEIISIDANKIIVMWNDNCKERFNISDFYKFVEILNENDIVSGNKSENIQKEIANENIETRKISKSVDESESNKKSELDSLYDNVFSEMEDEYSDIIDANPNKLQEQMLNRKMQSMEKKSTEKKINNIKEKAINDLISLMKDKKMIPNDSFEKVQKDQLFKMNDDEFEIFKKSIIDDTAKTENEMTEAEMMLQRIKFGGPVIGGFEKSNGSSSNGFSGGSLINHESRQLSSLNNKSETESISHTASSNESKLNLDGFKNLQGLTKPLQVQNQQKSMKENLTSAIADLDWTTMSKIY